MKYLILLLLLTGCTAFTTRQFDPVEYNYAVNISANATHAIHRCKSKNAEYNEYLRLINRDSFTLVEYISNKSDNLEALPAGTELRNITLSFLLKPKSSEQYCVHKLSNIQASARMYARAIGYDSKYDICDGELSSKVLIYKSSMDSELISREEYSDLVNDLVKMDAINKAGCKLENRQKLNKLIDGLKSISGLIF